MAKTKSKPAKAKRASKGTDAILMELRAFGMSYPGVTVKSPWPDHHDLAVKDKTFVYLSLPGEPLGVGCKLPKSSAMALMLPMCTPMAYGLGKSGWVSAVFKRAKDVPVDMVLEWIDESYRAIAPKTMIKALDAGVPPPKPPGKPRRHRSGAS